MISNQETRSKKVQRLRFPVLAILGLMLAMGSSAFATTSITFFLTVDEHGDSTPPADAVLVTVALNSSTSATVTFTSGSACSTCVAGYYMDDVFFNVSGDFTVGTITGTDPSYTATANQSLDSYGAVSEEVTPNDGDPSTSIVIPLTAVGGNSWGSPGAVLTSTCPSNDSIPTCAGGYGVPNPDSTSGYNAGYYSKGFDAFGKIGTSSTSGSDDDKDLAGYVSTPEPTSVLLLGSAVLLVAGAFRRKLVR